jgi:hydroxysqualene synthase
MDLANPADVETWSGKGRHDENFPVGSWLIARQYRDPIHRFYNFARNADDIADSSELSPEEKLVRLDIMEDVLLGRRDTGAPSAAALRASLRQSGVTSQHATNLLVAFRQDATKSRYATIEELDDYCRYSAVPVGRYVLDVHGESQRCHAASDALCTALQILNHIQDAAKDLAELDRCYLPQALLVRFDATIADLKQPAESPSLRHVFTTLLEWIDHLILAAAELPRLVRHRGLRLETGVIHGLAKRLARRLAQGDPLAQRVKLRKADALFSVLASLSYLK